MILRSRVRPGNQMNGISYNLKSEPMLWSASREFALAHAGPVMHWFVEQLCHIDAHMVIDTRLHMLMPGWLPCIGGWHLDEVTRRGGRPEIARAGSEVVSHALLVVSSVDDSLPEFAVGDLDIGEDMGSYEDLHDLVEEHIATRLSALRIERCQNRRVYFFDASSIHRGTKAKQRGWRYFIRASWNSKRQVVNEIRPQVQVYIESEKAGW